MIEVEKKGPTYERKSSKVDTIIPAHRLRMPFKKSNRMFVRSEMFSVSVCVENGFSTRLKHTAFQVQFKMSLHFVSQCEAHKADEISKIPFTCANEGKSKCQR